MKRISAEFWRNVYQITQEAKWDHGLRVHDALIAAGAKYGLSPSDLEKAGIVEPEPVSKPQARPGTLKGARR